MFSRMGPVFVILFVLVGIASPVTAQEDFRDYRQFFKKPETAPEYWNAMKFEIDVGQFELAAGHLLGFLNAGPTDEELLQIEEKEGMSSFLRLRNIPKWYDDPKKDKEEKQVREQVENLINRVAEVLEKKLTDPDRINKFINNLSATPEERVFAIRELRRSGAAAMPHIINRLLESKGNAPVQAAILTTLPRLYKNTVPPLLAALDVPDPELKVALIDVLMRRAETDAVPFLWYWSAAPDQPRTVRQKALQTLAYLTESTPDKMQPAHIMLTRLAENYYRHRVRFADPQQVIIWQWDGNKLVSRNVSPSQAEEYYGLHFARQALELEPRYEPAQALFVSLALDKAYEKAGLDQPLFQAAPGLKALLAQVNAALLIRVLDQALVDNRLPVILGSVRALAELGDVRAAQPSAQRYSVLERALNYPDRRVQMAAVDALLRLRGVPTTSSGRMVDVLRRMLAAGATPKALIADLEPARAEALAAGVKQAGFEPVIVTTGRDVLRRLREAGDIDLLLIDRSIPDPELPYLLSQLRADIDGGRLPVFVTLGGNDLTPIETLRLQRWLEQYPFVTLLPLPVPSVLKTVLPAQVTAAMGQPLSEAERAGFAAEAMIWLRKMAVGELPGYDIRVAEPAILQALEADDLAHLALQTLGRLPGQKAQRELARFLLDESRMPQLRAAAAEELLRHIQAHSVLLSYPQLRAIDQLQALADDPRLKSATAPLIGALRPDPRRTGQTLQTYTPAPPPEPVPGQEAR
ncbi:MAG: hypothetical protein ACK4RK_01560 [Gemmataceae bacterium]